MALIDRNEIATGAAIESKPLNDMFVSLWKTINGELDGSNIADLSINDGHMVEGAITEINEALADNCVVERNIKANAVTKAKIADDAVGSAKLDNTDGAEAVSTSHLQDGAVTTLKLADDSVTEAKMVVASVTDPITAVSNWDIAAATMKSSGNCRQLSANGKRTSASTISADGNGKFGSGVAVGTIANAADFPCMDTKCVGYIQNGTGTAVLAGYEVKTDGSVVLEYCAYPVQIVLNSVYKYSVTYLAGI